MSWRSVYNKKYSTSNPNLLIASVCNYPHRRHSIEELNEDYDINRLNADEVYRDIIAYYYLAHGGREFIPIGFSDRYPKLANLQKLTPVGDGFFWCVGYVSLYLNGGASSVRKPCTSITTPDFETLLLWLKHYTQNYNSSRGSTISSNLFVDALRKYINDNAPETLHQGRKSQLIYNNHSPLVNDINSTPADWVKHLENLKNRNIYEIMVNDFI
jgi:hypothetical protein